MKTKRIERPGFRAALQGETLELLIYEDIGESWWGEGVTAKTIKREIDAAGKFSNILVRINSDGGDPFQAFAIGNILRGQKKPIEVRVDGVAASSASVIAMAGDKIIMGPNAMQMIHNASTFAMGYASDLRKVADDLDKISGVIAQTYRDRTGREIGEIVSMMDGETWMTAQECVENGFATEIDAGDGQLVTEAKALAMVPGFKLMKRFAHVPDRFRAGAAPVLEECLCDCENCLAEDCRNCTNASCTDPNCAGCPMQESGVDDMAALEPYEISLKLKDAWLNSPLN